jgi:hypothetical protein
MKRRSLILAALVLPATVLGAADLREPLRPLQFLVGSCWTGTFPDGTSTDTHCFEPVFDGQFVRDRHHVRGGATPYAGETIYAWDPRQKRIVYTYWASDGAISSGYADSSASGEITFPESHTDEAGKRTTMKNVWTPRGTDAYEAWAAEEKDGQWKELWRMTLRRDGPAR